MEQIPISNANDLNAPMNARQTTIYSSGFAFPRWLLHLCVRAGRSKMRGRRVASGLLIDVWGVARGLCTDTQASVHSLSVQHLKHGATLVHIGGVEVEEHWWGRMGGDRGWRRGGRGWGQTFGSVLPRHPPSRPH